MTPGPGISKPHWWEEPRRREASALTSTQSLLMGGKLALVPSSSASANQQEDKMAEYKGAAKEGARAMALKKKREKMKADIEAAKNKISEVSFVFNFFWKFLDKL